MGRLLDAPQVLAQTGDGSARVEDNLRAVQAQATGAIREVAVVADVYADFAVLGIEYGVAGVAGLEEEFLPEAFDLRDMVLAVLAQVGAVGVDDGSGVVVNAGHFDFVDRDDDDHVVLLGVFAHQLGGGTVRDLLGQVVPLGILRRAEVGAGEDFLEAQHLDAFFTGFFDVGDVGVDHRLAVFFAACLGGGFVCELDDCCSYCACHGFFSFKFYGFTSFAGYTGPFPPRDSPCSRGAN